jgi:hypothetical protein
MSGVQSVHCMVGVAAGIRTRAVEVGWVETRARNRWLLWRDRLGRLQWFETGRVNLYVRKPVNLGKVYQLVCNGFSFTGLITDIKVLEKILASVRFKRAHYVFPTGNVCLGLRLICLRKATVSFSRLEIGRTRMLLRSLHVILIGRKGMNGSLSS